MTHRWCCVPGPLRKAPPGHRRLSRSLPLSLSQPLLKAHPEIRREGPSSPFLPRLSPPPSLPPYLCTPPPAPSLTMHPPFLSHSLTSRPHLLSLFPLPRPPPPLSLSPYSLTHSHTLPLQLPCHHPLPLTQSLSLSLSAPPHSPSPFPCHPPRCLPLLFFFIVIGIHQRPCQDPFLCTMKPENIHKRSLKPF